jgi:hypothetical protein
VRIEQDWTALRRWIASPAATGPLLAGTGLVLWTGLSVWGGMGEDTGFRLREAWDTAAYFYVGLPAMALAVAIAAFHMPRRSWRWPLWVVGGHQAGVLLVGIGMQSGLSLIILTMLLAVILTAVLAVPALVGSVLARRMVW